MSARTVMEHLGLAYAGYSQFPCLATFGSALYGQVNNGGIIPPGVSGEARVAAIDALIDDAVEAFVEYWDEADPREVREEIVAGYRAAMIEEWIAHLENFI
mgnify:FL=1